MIRSLTVIALSLPLVVGAGGASAKADPLEFFNRTMFAFNSRVVDYVIEPLTGFSRAWVPSSVRQAGSNVYANLNEPEFIITNLFTGNNSDAMASAGRFAVNSTIGIGGLFDPATNFGLIRRETEFGESLCALGVPTSPYLVLPFVGSSNAWSAGLLTGFFAVEWYALSLISTLLASADLVVDLGASAASLRHAADQPDMAASDPYLIQRAEYLEYIEKGCGTSAHGGKPSLLAAH
ncbi:MAG: MlaA family lipoprotein [Rhodospirillaceae bacterium]